MQRPLATGPTQPQRAKVRRLPPKNPKTSTTPLRCKKNEARRGATMSKVTQPVEWSGLGGPGAPLPPELDCEWGADVRLAFPGPCLADLGRAGHPPCTGPSLSSLTGATHHIGLGAGLLPEPNPGCPFPRGALPCTLDPFPHLTWTMPCSLSGQPASELQATEMNSG